MAHGKSTVVKAISGVHTVRFKNELERNITIKLGYANAKVSNGDHGHFTEGVNRQTVTTTCITSAFGLGDMGKNTFCNIQKVF